MNQPIHVLFLVGGAGSEYLKQRIKVRLPWHLGGHAEQFLGPVWVEDRSHCEAI